MDLLPSQLQDVLVLRRLFFAAVYLPKDLPQYWSIVGNCLSESNDVTLEPEKCRLDL